MLSIKRVTSIMGGGDPPTHILLKMISEIHIWDSDTCKNRNVI